jgi:hypothetical protein
MQGGLFAATAPDLKFSAHTEIYIAKFTARKNIYKKYSITVVGPRARIG